MHDGDRWEWFPLSFALPLFGLETVIFIRKLFYVRLYRVTILCHEYRLCSLEPLIGRKWAFSFPTTQNALVNTGVLYATFLILTSGDINYSGGFRVGKGKSELTAGITTQELDTK